MKVHGRFGGTYKLQLQGRIKNQANNQQDVRSKLLRPGSFTPLLAPTGSLQAPPQAYVHPFFLTRGSGCLLFLPRWLFAWLNFRRVI